MDWLAFAVASMVLLSISNLFLKIVVSNPAFSRLDYKQFIIPGLLILIGIAIALYFLWQKMPSQVYFAIGILIFATLGVVAMIFALQKGKIAIVTAILSLSTILVALLSFMFLGDRFSGKEIAAMVMAIMSLLILVV